MTTDEIDIRPHQRKQRTLEEMGEEYGGGDSQTMQLTPEQLAMLNELAGMGNQPRADFQLEDTQPVTINYGDTQPILVDADPDEQA